MKENEFGILMHYTYYCGCECVYGGISLRISYICVLPTMLSSRDHLRKLPILHIHVPIFVLECMFCMCPSLMKLGVFIVTTNNTVFLKLPIMCEREYVWLRIYLHNQNSMF